ncbi:bifunctional heptose 7-phosphate kinase/heptose 1-phosphate adenyltransferase [Desulfonatronovibrio magnus]|uniref:bifunctional heptose 7-phosphate kinase/heptose 1-phosphate adenyltransferase n=1 Tax=Desulfonatronovibrio magnus TaxID=698827 RepID=UPI0005EBEF4C|nr:bifunctional ADP-heptose synthase [Desulfonatronovibrio magnus]
MMNGRTDTLLNLIDRQNNIIIGDIILDHYQWGEVSRISPEAPVPVVVVENETYRLGGAANVARNCKAIGGSPYLIGVVGCDSHADMIEKLLHEEGIDSGILRSDNRRTTVKTRVMGNTQQIVRVDMESINPLNESEQLQLQQFWNESPDSDFVIISDYGKGAIDDFILKMVNRKIIIDPKNKNFANYHRGFIMTPNLKEAREMSGIDIQSREDLITAGKNIIDRCNLNYLLITMGPHGMALFDENKVVQIKNSARTVFDVTGAGDTVIGVLCSALEAGIDLKSACIIANTAAGLVVGQIGTAAASKSEVQKALVDISMDIVDD